MRIHPRPGHPVAWWGTGMLVLVLVLACSRQRDPVAPVTGFLPPEAEMVNPQGWPRSYKWMLAPDLVAAHWLGARVNGKELVEPINLMLLDRRATTPEAAEQALRDALSEAGFPSRTGHSGGYAAFADGRLWPQVPQEPNHAFSDRPFELANDHGRLFGPVPWQGGFLWLGAFSREAVAPLDRVKHRYVSFVQARDRVAAALTVQGGFGSRGAVDLQNRLDQDPQHTTGDHDGTALLLERR